MALRQGCVFWIAAHSHSHSRINFFPGNPSPNKVFHSVSRHNLLRSERKTLSLSLTQPKKTGAVCFVMYFYHVLLAFYIMFLWIAKKACWYYTLDIGLFLKNSRNKAMFNIFTVGVKIYVRLFLMIFADHQIFFDMKVDCWIFEGHITYFALCTTDVFGNC